VCDTTSSAATYWQVGRHTCFVLHSGTVRTNRCGPNNSFVAELKLDEGDCYRSIFSIPAHLNLRGASVQCIVPTEQGNRTVGQGNMQVIGELTLVPSETIIPILLSPAPQTQLFVTCSTEIGEDFLNYTASDGKMGESLGRGPAKTTQRQLKTAAMATHTILWCAYLMRSSI